MDEIKLHIGQILEEAQHRWMSTAEVYVIIQNYQEFLTAPKPPHRPPSGSLFLFNRKELRYFRHDGHKWRNKRGGKTVKEVHERLKVGTEVLHCYHAYGEENESFERRCYWLIEDERSHIVLVHYLEIKKMHMDLNMCSTTSLDETQHVGLPSSLDLVATPDQQLKCPMQDSVIKALRGSPSESQSGLQSSSGHQISYHLNAKRKADCSSLEHHSFDQLNVIQKLRWISKELALDEAHAQSSSEIYLKGVENEDRVDDSNVGSQAPMYSFLDISFSPDQYFTITEYSPGWAYAGSEIEVLIFGNFMKNQQEVQKCKFACMFGDVEVPLEIVEGGLLCQAPVHKAGIVPSYITLSNRLACSEVREFEFRDRVCQNGNVPDTSIFPVSETLKPMNFERMRSLGSSNPSTSVPRNHKELAQLDNCTTQSVEAHSTNPGGHVNSEEVNVNLISAENITNSVMEPVKGDRINISYEDLELHFGKNLNEVAASIGVSRSTIKRICRDKGIFRWPSHMRNKPSPFSQSRGCNTKPASVHRRSPHCNIPDVQEDDGALTNDNMKSTIQDGGMVTIKASYENIIMKFQLSNVSKLSVLEQEVGKRLNFNVGKFIMEYQDEENDWVSILCDADLLFCFKSLNLPGNSIIRMKVRVCYTPS